MCTFFVKSEQTSFLKLPALISSDVWVPGLSPRIQPRHFFNWNLLPPWTWLWISWCLFFLSCPYHSHIIRKSSFSCPLSLDRHCALNLCVLIYRSVCGSLYELVTDLPESEMPYHFYTDQRFALVLLCVLLILPLSIPKEISIQKYIRSGVMWECMCERCGEPLKYTSNCLSTRTHGLEIRHQQYRMCWYQFYHFGF